MEKDLTEQIEKMQQTIRELLEQNDRLTALNRHYLHYFYQGDVLKMQADFSYLSGDQGVK